MQLPGLLVGQAQAQRSARGRGKGQGGDTYLPYSSLLIWSLCIPRAPCDSEKGFTDCDSIWLLVTLLNRATLEDSGESCKREKKIENRTLVNGFQS